MRLSLLLLIACLVVACTDRSADAFPVASDTTPIPHASPTPPPLLVQHLVPNLRSADQLTLQYRWEGLSLSAPHGVRTVLDLTTKPIASVLTITVGGYRMETQTQEMRTTLTEAQLTTAVTQLQMLPLTSGSYTPTLTHTDDYPTLSMVFALQGKTIVFRSTSQGATHVPWEAIIDNQSYSIYSEELFAVWEIFQPTLQPEALQAAIDTLETK